MKRQTKDGTWHDFGFNAEMLRQELMQAGVPENDVNDYVACDLQRQAQIAAGGLYYDYERQVWVNS